MSIEHRSDKNPMTRDFLSLFRGSLLAAVLILGAHTASAVWSNPPAGTPPTCSDPAIPGCNPPLNTGNAFQYKNGAGLLINDVDSNNSYSAYGLIVRYGKVGIGTISPTETLEIASGNLALPATTATAGAIMRSGTPNVPILHTYGSENFFAGANAGNFTMTSSWNTGVGGGALSKNAGGAGGNAAFGYGALFANLAGFNNTGIGASALFQNTGGNENAAVGVSALRSNLTGGENTAVGVSALYSTTGSYNVAVGRSAGFVNTIGTKNTFIGYKAGGIAPTTAALTNATAIGNNAQVSASNSMALGGTGVDAANVILGGTSASAGLKLDVEGKAGATEYCDNNGNNCVSAATLGSGNGIGVGQTWQNVTRTGGTVYQNTTGKPIMVNARVVVSSETYTFSVSADNISWVPVNQTVGTGANDAGRFSVIVPNGHYYRITVSGSGGGGIVSWVELR